MNKPSSPKVNALVIIAHGSSVSSANEEFFLLIEMLREKLGASNYCCIAACFLEIAKPDLKSCIRSIIAEHANKSIQIDIMPYFLTSGKHVEKDIPSQIADLEEEYPDLSFRLFDYMGKGGALLSALFESIIENSTNQ